MKMESEKFQSTAYSLKYFLKASGGLASVSVLCYQILNPGGNMKVLILTLAMLAFAPAFAAKEKAAPKPKPVEQPTPFSELAEAWEKGTPLKFDEVDGFYSGRCYERSAKTTMLPGLLAIQSVDAGPHFPNKSENYICRSYNSAKYPTADAYDHISTDEQKKKLLENMGRYSLYLSQAKEEEKGLTYAEYFGGTLTPAHKGEFRKLNGYFLFRFITVAGVEMNERATGYRKEFDAGVVTEYCYFFKQIIPKADISKYR